MDKTTQQQRAAKFGTMHTGNDVLVLPNAWDVGSAVVFERAGFSAVATTSAGIAYSLGHADGEQVTLDDLLSVVTRIVARVSLPVSVDVEMGYGESVGEVCETVRRVVDAGGVGINIEDGVPGEEPSLVDANQQVEMLSAVAGLRDELGVPFVINARTDGLWLKTGEESARIDEAVARGNRYLGAGADCVFVPGLLDVNAIKALVDGINGPLNVIATPVCPAVDELRDMGVARLSLGSGPVRAAYTTTLRIAEELKRSGTLAAMSAHAMSYAEANALFG